MLNVESYIHFMSNKHPDIFRDYPIKVITEGSANIVLWVQGPESWIFRIPRQDNAASSNQMKREQFILPKLKGKIPFIPQISHMSEYPLQYIGYPWIAGKPLYPVLLSQLTLVEKASLAKELADFISAVHMLSGALFFPPSEGAPSSSYTKWSNYLASIQHYVFPYLDKAQKEWTVQLFEMFLSNEKHFKYTPCFINGDLKPAHILVDETTHRLSGIIDLGLMQGDPALDFGYLGLGRVFQDMLLQHYTGPQDETFQKRILFYEKTVPFFGLRYGVIYNLQEVFKSNMLLLNALIAEQP